MTDEEIMNELKLNFDISKAGTISIENGLVSCTGNILLGPNKITELPVKFRTVGGDFLCYHNKLTSLAGAPQSVGRSFNCNNNELTSLRGAPQSVGGGFACSGNQLTSLRGAPQSVGGHFNCSGNQLTSLAGAPRYVHRSFYCSENQLTSLAGAPQYVGENFKLTYRKSLALLSLLMIKGCESIDFKYHNDFTDTKLSSILDRYLGTGTQGMLACAEEMHEAGYGSNANYD